MNTEHYKEALETEKKTLEHELAGVGRKNMQVPGDFEPRGSELGAESDPGDQAKTVQSYEENEGVERNLEARFDKVLAALARIEAGTYGVCTIGGENIEKDRLSADPAAETCVRHIQ